MSNILIEGAEKKRGLGRGLGSLFGETEAPRTTVVAAPAEDNKSPYKMVDIEKIIPNPLQPRKHFAEEKLAELSLSIKAHGVIQPILVAPTKAGEYQIIAGERRWRAAQLAGLKQLPIIIKEAHESKNLELAIIENIQRQDLNPIEEAKACLHLIKKYGYTQGELAEKLGKDRTTIANTLRILALDAQVLEQISMGQLSMGHAKALLSIESKARQRSLAKKAIEEGLSVRTLEKMAIQGTQESTQDIQNTATKDRDALHCEAIACELEKKLGTKTVIDYQNGKGTIRINFYSKDQLNELVEKLRNL